MISLLAFLAAQSSGPGSEPFLIIPFDDIAAFATCITLAVAWRQKPELHRRLIFIATCLLTDAAFARFDFIFDPHFSPVNRDINPSPAGHFQDIMYLQHGHMHIPGSASAPEIDRTVGDSVAVGAHVSTKCNGGCESFVEQIQQTFRICRRVT